ncbi:hypothetical protein CRG98_013791 [Punica granatum]|uniref:Uncharacterized protein n=1 Tax=Punica granatum TaxID=22663 RepID=A0A2I0KBA0_PUNGR|nr:hypothetical protein CRG98_013791 [Punica granatum]
MDTIAARGGAAVSATAATTMEEVGTPTQPHKHEEGLGNTRGACRGAWAKLQLHGKGRKMKGTAGYASKQKRNEKSENMQRNEAVGSKELEEQQASTKELKGAEITAGTASSSNIVRRGRLSRCTGGEMVTIPSEGERLELVADVRGRGEAAGGVAAEEGGVRKRRKGGVHSTLLSQSRRSRRVMESYSGALLMSYLRAGGPKWGANKSDCVNSSDEVVTPNNTEDEGENGRKGKIFKTFNAKRDMQNINFKVCLMFETPRLRLIS